MDQKQIIKLNKGQGLTDILPLYNNCHYYGNELHLLDKEHMLEMP